MKTYYHKNNIQLKLARKQTQPLDHNQLPMKKFRILKISEIFKMLMVVPIMINYRMNSSYIIH